MTLSPYQYQIGNVAFGLDTDIPVSKVDLQTYNVNAQDFQVARTDENRFGVDTLVPGPIIFTMAVLDNYALPNMAGLSEKEVPESIMSSGILLPALAKEWKANDIRPHWGYTKPLLFCDSDGITRRIYGRPGKFTYARKSRLSAWFDVQAEFRRADTYAYNDTEYYIGPIAPSTAPITATRQDGDADSWLRILIQGPFTHPIITYGSNTIELDITLASTESLELSTYPWQRRIVDSNNINWRAKMIGNTQYLDQIKFTAGQSMPISWICSSATAQTAMYFLWREAYNVV